MPTHEETMRFLRDFRKLTHARQKLFLKAIAMFLEGLKCGRFRSSLRVKRFQGHEGVWEMTWAADGRALFRYGDSILPCEKHIIWLRVGGHEIFEDEVE